MTVTIGRRELITLLGSAAAAWPLAARAQQWPVRAIKVVSPFPAGSASDTVSRVVLDQASRLLGQPVVIEVRPGAGGIVGFAAVAKSEPDGYTLVTSSSSMATEAALHRRLGRCADWHITEPADRLTRQRVQN